MNQRTFQVIIGILAGIMLFILLTSGCSSTPYWSDASPRDRERGYFIIDDAYYASPQFTNDMRESARVVAREAARIGKRP